MMLRLLFFMLIIRPLVFVVLGLGVRGRAALPQRGPAVVVANHNSHLDAVVLMSLFPLRVLRRLRPAAAADYFLRSPALDWFARRIIGIIPLDRDARSRGEDPLVGVRDALSRGDIVFLFPEGTRGEPERMSELKKGISYLAEQFPEVPTTPVFIRGLGKALPKGAWIPVPFFCEVSVGEPLRWTGDRESFMEALRGTMSALAATGHETPWE